MKTWQPLAGVRVLSFELAFALPAGTRALHDLGAEVVRVSPPARQVDRYIGFIDGVFQGKSSISIDLAQRQGRDVAQALAARADVVCNNFRPGVLDKYGLGADSLRRVHPELITLQLSGYGTPGPWSQFPAFGPSTEAAGGLNRLLVNEGEVPLRVGPGVFSDQLAGRYAALAVVSALHERRTTGAGVALDLSMTAGITHMLGQSVTRVLMDGAMPVRHGNRDRRFVPQGLYRTLDPAAGTTDLQASDEWLALSIANDSQWRKLVDCVAADSPDADWDADWDAAERWRRHDEIDATLHTYCATRRKDDLAQQFQSAGVPAAPVRTVKDQALDPNIKARGTLPLLHHAEPVLGYAAHPHPELPWRIVGQARRKPGHYRHTGCDNSAVLRDWLGYSQAQVRRLAARNVLYEEPSLELRSPPATRHHDPAHAAVLGLPRQSRRRANSARPRPAKPAPGSAISAQPLCVLELSAGAMAGYAGALLAALGGSVTRVDATGKSDPELLTGAASHAFLHSGKQSCAPGELDLNKFNVLVEDIGPTGLRRLGWSYRRLRSTFPNLSIVSLSAFGRKGAYANWLASDLLAQAVGGTLHVTGYAGETPRMLPGEAAYMIAGLHGATAAYSAALSGSAVRIEISAQDTLMQHWTRHVSDYAYSGTTMPREKRNPKGLHRRHTAMAADGWLYLLALREPWQDLAAFLGLGDFITAEAWEPGAPQPDWSLLEAAFANSVASRGKYDWFAAAAELGWTFAPVLDPLEIAGCEQVLARGGMATVTAPTQPDRGATVEVPPLPWTIRRGGDRRPAAVR